MIIQLVQFNPTVGDLQQNAAGMLQIYRQACYEGTDLVIFPELSLCGYPPMDLLERKAFIEQTGIEVEKLIQATRGQQTGLLFGSIIPHEGKGRPLFNAALLASEGKLLHTARKTLLPTYDVFDEFRYFEPNKRHEPVTFRGVKLGITICEDIWNHENEVSYHEYDIDPAAILVGAGAELLINISASPFTKHKPELRERMLANHTRRLKVPLVYVNQTGANTELIFDGDSMALNPSGEALLRLPLFESSEGRVMFSDGELQPLAGTPSAAELPCMEERIFRALLLGLRDYLKKTGIASDIVLGLSGGIDSALVSVIAAEALGAEKVHSITMPSSFSSSGSVSDSEVLAKNLGINFHEIPIAPIYDAYINQLNPLFEGTGFNVAEENLQSRSRGALLMAVSNKFGYILLNTGNKSEMAVGYCTLYGDMAGGLSILSDVYKTEVYAMARWLNEHYYKREVIPQTIIDKAPSAELRPDQKDSDSLPDYDMMDAVLYRYIELQKSTADIAAELGNEDIVRKLVHMVDLNEYKRRQAAPGLRVSIKAFGSGRRLPIVQRWTHQK
jgi:NAD+ synthetase